MQIVGGEKISCVKVIDLLLPHSLQQAGTNLVLCLCTELRS